MQFGRYRVNFKIQKWLLPVAVALLLLYTADQLLTGERGIVTWRVMKTQVENLRVENEGMQSDITRLEKRIAHLKPTLKEGEVRVKGEAATNSGKLDQDFVDELVRRDLGYLKPGEQIILVSSTQTQAE